MFDNLVAAHGPQGRSRARTIVITTSVIVHAAAIAVLAITAMWRIDKIEFDKPGSRVSALMLPHNSGGGDRAEAKLMAKPKDDKVVKTKPDEPVQPKKQLEEEQIVTEIESEGGQGTGESATPGDGGGGDGKGSGVPTGPKCLTDRCDGGGLGGGVPKDEVEVICLEGEKLIDGKCVKDKVHTIAPDVMRGLRKSGNEQIPAPQSVRVSMMRANESQLIGTIKLCIGTDGRIDRVQVLKSTGYDAYDDALVDAIRDWRYDPYTVEGEPVPACVAVNFKYVMK